MTVSDYGKNVNFRRYACSSDSALEAVKTDEQYGTNAAATFPIITISAGDEYDITIVEDQISDPCN